MLQEAAQIVSAPAADPNPAQHNPLAGRHRAVFAQRGAGNYLRRRQHGAGPDHGLQKPPPMEVYYWVSMFRLLWVSTLLIPSRFTRSVPFVSAELDPGPIPYSIETRGSSGSAGQFPRRKPSASALQDALQDVDLQIGQTYHVQVKGRWIELRVLPDQPWAETSDSMLDPWLEFPPPAPQFRLPPRAALSPCPIHPAFLPMTYDL